VKTHTVRDENVEMRPEGGARRHGAAVPEAERSGVEGKLKGEPRAMRIHIERPVAQETDQGDCGFVGQLDRQR
jgi:hypothetical protein